VYAKAGLDWCWLVEIGIERSGRLEGRIAGFGCDEPGIQSLRTPPRKMFAVELDDSRL
jgi:hypothetical protein